MYKGIHWFLVQLFFCIAFFSADSHYKGVKPLSGLMNHGFDLVSKFPKSQSKQASVGRAG